MRNIIFRATYRCALLNVLLNHFVQDLKRGRVALQDISHMEHYYVCLGSAWLIRRVVFSRAICRSSQHILGTKV